MDAERIVIKAGEEKQLVLPGRGARALMLVYHAEDTNIATIIRREIKSAEELGMKLQPGDAVPAFFILTGKQAGQTTIVFAEKKIGMPDSTDKVIKTVQVEVTD